MSAADEALEVIEGNNGYATSEPEERNAIVNSIKGTIAAIKEGAPSASAIKSSLIAPLQYLVRKFTDTAIGIASKVAVEKIANLAFTSVLGACVGFWPAALLISCAGA